MSQFKGRIFFKNFVSKTKKIEKFFHKKKIKKVRRNSNLKEKKNMFMTMVNKSYNGI